MKKLTISLLSILAVATMLTGCGESDGSISGSSSDKSSASSSSNSGSSEESSTSSSSNSGNGSSVVVDNGNVKQTTITNEFGLSSSLGVPPALPAD